MGASDGSVGFKDRGFSNDDERFPVETRLTRCRVTVTLTKRA
jgi:hypothetical protein